MDNFLTNLTKTQMFKEIKIEKVYMRVVKQIRELIKNGKLKPGDKLPPERILAERLGVSRPSVREGIVALEILGLVESRGGKGNTIKSLAGSSYPDQDLAHLEQGESPFEVLEARKIIEVEAAGYAAQRAQMDDIATIDQTLDSMSSIAPRISLSQGYEKGMESWREFHKFGREFHINVARAARNTVLLRIVTQLIESLLREDLRSI
jgi:DNA-binding FadR family transcriptional regulator